LKKFVFSLQSVYKYKQTQRDQKQNELAKAQNKLNELREREKELIHKLSENARQYENGLNTGMSPVQIAWYDNYTVFLNHRLAKLAVLIRDAERIAELKKSELVAIMREIKTLERLKEEQYLTYMEDSAKEQEKELGDLMSFQSTGEKGNLIPEMA